MRSSELEGDNAAAAAREEVDLLGTKTESISNGEDVTGLLSGVEVDE